MTKILSALLLLLRNPVYFFISLLLGLALFFLYFWINDSALFRSAASISTSLPFLWEVFVNHIHNVAKTTGWANVSAVSAIAALGGINLSLTLFRVRRTGVFIGRTSFLGILGAAGGVFAASCAACSTALISLLGVTGGLVIFPFGGLEISALAITLLGISLYYLSKSLSESGLLG